MKNRSLAGCIAVGFALATVAGCGGSKQPASTADTQPEPEQVIAQAPNWYTSPPEDSLAVTATASEVSADMQLAVDKAKTSARSAIAEQLSTKYEGLTKRFQEETGVGGDSELLDQYVNAYKTVTQQVLEGTSAREQEIVAEGDRYRAYVLMELSLSQANQALMDRIKNNDRNMWTRFRATEAWEELEQEIEAYEEEQSQGPGGDRRLQSIR